MLKSEQLCYRISSPNVKPRFVDPGSPFLLELAAELIAIYTGAVSGTMTRQELEEAAGGIVRASGDVKTAAGLKKLLADRCESSVPADLDYPALRRESFLKSAAMLAKPDFSVEKLAACAAGDLYGDLPDLEKITSFREITPANLLHRYNLAQAQGLLFYAETLTLKLRNCEPSALRKLFKSIKFFRLLARFSIPRKDLVQVDISGPYSLFGTTAKYALQLANLLPAIVDLPHWELTASLKLKNRELNLRLSHKNQLVSHYRDLAGYIPEEIRLYHRQFNEKQNLWQIIGEAPFIDAGEQEIIFPDLSFASMQDGRIVHLELFHRWHAGQLERRIKLLAAHPELPLILGIDRTLVKDEAAYDSLFADAPAIKERCWLFRDFPGVATTLNVLKKFTRQLPSHRAE